MHYEQPKTLVLRGLQYIAGLREQVMQLTNFIIVLLIVAGAGSIVVNATSVERHDPIAYVPSPS